MGIEIVIAIISTLVSVVITAIIAGISSFISGGRATSAEVYEIIVDWDQTKKQIRKKRNLKNFLIPPIIVGLINAAIVIFVLKVLLKNGMNIRVSTILQTITVALIFIFSLIVIAYICITILVRNKKKPFNWSLLASSFITIFILFLIPVFFINNIVNNWTVYIIVDKSVFLESQFESITSSLKAALIDLPLPTKFGIGVFGNATSEESQCENYQEVLSPTTDRTKYSPALEWVDQQKASNFSPLNNAILFFVDILKDKKGNQQLIIITSKTDPKCSPLERWRADNILGESDREVKFDIISMGQVNDEDKTLYKLYADRYKHVDNEEELIIYIKELLQLPPSVYGAVNQVYGP